MIIEMAPRLQRNTSYRTVVVQTCLFAASIYAFVALNMKNLYEASREGPSTRFKAANGYVQRVDINEASSSLETEAPAFRFVFFVGLEDVGYHFWNNAMDISPLSQRLEQLQIVPFKVVEGSLYSTHARACSNGIFSPNECINDMKGKKKKGQLPLDMVEGEKNLATQRNSPTRRHPTHQEPQPSIPCTFC